MKATDSLLLLARTYGEHLQLELSQVSWRALGDSKKLDAIEGGADLSTRRFERAVQWFADNWPEEAVWPPTLDRPRGLVKAVSA